MCPACRASKQPGDYLCRGCWFTLRPSARRLLSRHDGEAAHRFGQLLDQINAKVKLHQITIT